MLKIKKVNFYILLGLIFTLLFNIYAKDKYDSDFLAIKDLYIGKNEKYIDIHIKSSLLKQN